MKTKKQTKVRAWTEDTIIPTYNPAPPDLYPMFLERRVYQGSSGAVYPLPCTDRISEVKTDRKWKAIWLENEFLRVMVLPEIGGRIHAIQDRTNGYELIYRQHVIKPALVGLAGPWISGGIEFNWPQHHRPGTFMPVDFELERSDDGSVTAWCSDHDFLTRMKGMHGVCLHPGRAGVELKVRVSNRTPLAQTFLWWANVATRVHEAYQSFFPPDVYYIADHAKRAMSAYPQCRGRYYGVDYAARARHGVPKEAVPAQFIPPHCGGAAPVAYAPNDLSFYANIPVPTSYMCMGSQEDFFGGYDHRQQAGIVHIANHHISPGKKQWTWGNHEFGYAWDRNLTDADAQGEFAPYIEIMAGVYTDNQPDFSFLQPGETRTWSQYWYPIHRIGPAQHANLEAALSLSVDGDKVRAGISVTRHHARARIRVLANDKPVLHRRCDLAPGSPFVKSFRLPARIPETCLTIRVETAAGQELIAYTPRKRNRGEVPPPASEPPPPREMASTDELYVTGLHLEQYRHATRCPTIYWREALRRDPLDARCNNAMGRWHLRRGEFPEAEAHLRKAIERLTSRNPNPADGEPLYNLGLCLRHQGLDREAYDAFYKATWNQAWAGAAYHALGEIDCARGDWARACDHLDRSCQTAAFNHRAANLHAIALRQLGKHDAANALLRSNKAADPLDWWTHHLLGDRITCDTQTKLDLALDYARAGLFREAIRLLQTPRMTAASDSRELGAKPLLHYHLGSLHSQSGNAKAALADFKRASAAAPDYCFPARLEEIAILETARRANPKDARAPYYLGNLLFARRRHMQAITAWERAAKLDPAFPIVWRNLGIGYYNICHDAGRARAAYERAFRLAPDNARLLFERDQLWKRLGVPPRERLKALEKHRGLADRRDDLSVELCALYNLTGQHTKALQLVVSRHFQPWEGGEGQALGQYVRCHLTLGRQALHHQDPARARDHFQRALKPPVSLGEARHILANQSDVKYWLGRAYAASGHTTEALKHWRAAANFQGDFQEMSVRTYSEMTYFSALAWGQLGRSKKKRQILLDLLAYARQLRKTPAKIDYFATSLPTMLLFEDDLQARQETTALFLEAQAQVGLGRRKTGRTLLQKLLARDPNHSPASDLMEEVASS